MNDPVTGHGHRWRVSLLVEASPANLDRLLSGLADFGEGFARELSRADFPMEEGAVRVIEDFMVDLFTVMRGRTYADFAKDARQLEIDDCSIRYLGPEALVELKSASHREKDRLDVSALRAIMTGVASLDAVDLAKLTPPAGASPEDTD